VVQPHGVLCRDCWYRQLDQALTQGHNFTAPKPSARCLQAARAYQLVNPRRGQADQARCLLFGDLIIHQAPGLQGGRLVDVNYLDRSTTTILAG
jgi:hypothetical protein